MIVSTMTYAELEKEVQSDYEELSSFVLIKGKVLQRKYKSKFKSIPLLKRSNHFESEVVIHTSSKNNTWYLLMSIYKKGVNFSAHLRTEDKNGYRFITTGGDTIYIHTNHFFSRYNERYLEHLNNNINNTWIHFFATHPVPVYTHTKYKDSLITSTLYTVFNFGIGLSTKIENHDIIEVGTFVSYDMLKKNQLKLVVELIFYMLELIEGRSGSKSDQILKRDLTVLFVNITKKVGPLLSEYGYDINKPSDLYKLLKDD